MASYEVEAILQKRAEPGSQPQFLVKWRGYPRSETTWSGPPFVLPLRVLLRPEAVCIAARDALERALRAAGEVWRRRDSHRIEEAAAAVKPYCVPKSPPIDPITTPQPDSSDCGVLVHKLI